MDFAHQIFHSYKCVLADEDFFSCSSLLLKQKPAHCLVTESYSVLVSSLVIRCQNVCPEPMTKADPLCHRRFVKELPLNDYLLKAGVPPDGCRKLSQIVLFLL